MKFTAYERVREKRKVREYVEESMDDLTDGEAIERFVARSQHPRQRLVAMLERD